SRSGWFGRRGRRTVVGGDRQPVTSREEERRIEANVFSIFMATWGLAVITRLKTQDVIPRSWIAVSAVTVAVRGPSSSSEISPNESPGPSFLRVRPLTVTFAVPSTIRKNPRPCSPSVASTAPAGWLTSLAAPASADSSFLDRSWNSGTLASSSVLSVLATVRSFSAGRSRGRILAGRCRQRVLGGRRALPDLGVVDEMHPNGIEPPKAFDGRGVVRQAFVVRLRDPARAFVPRPVPLPASQHRLPRNQDGPFGRPHQERLMPRSVARRGDDPESGGHLGLSVEELVPQARHVHPFGDGVVGFVQHGPLSPLDEDGPAGKQPVLPAVVAVQMTVPDSRHVRYRDPVLSEDVLERPTLGGELCVDLLVPRPDPGVEQEDPVAVHDRV